MVNLVAATPVRWTITPSSRRATYLMGRDRLDRRRNRRFRRRSRRRPHPEIMAVDVFQCQCARLVYESPPPLRDGIHVGGDCPPLDVGVDNDDALLLVRGSRRRRRRRHRRRRRDRGIRRRLRHRIRLSRHCHRRLRRLCHRNL